MKISLPFADFFKIFASIREGAMKNDKIFQNAKMNVSCISIIYTEQANRHTVFLLRIYLLATSNFPRNKFVGFSVLPAILIRV